MSITPAAGAVLAEPQASPCFVAPLGDELIRRELHGPEQLEALARQLAAASTVAPAGTRGQPLLRRVLSNTRFLHRAFRHLRDLSRRQSTLTPDAEWLLDNWHVIEEVLREVRQDLPRGYYALLPKLAAGILAGYPRVYALALALVAHTDSSLDEAHITRFVRSYQSVAPLTIGELWAVPTMLRLGLLENLRRLAQNVLVRWQDNLRASRFACKPWAEDCPPRGLRAPLTDGFVLHLLRSLQDAGPHGETGTRWLEKHLLERGTDIHEVLRRESQRQAASQVCVGNCVTSLRLLAALDWSSFVERQSRVEALLRQDPAGIYEQQDFASRDQYRQVIERLARGSGVSETDVAGRAVEKARAAGADDPRRRHVGYYLISAGRFELQQELGYVPRLRQRLLDLARARPRTLYFGGLALLTLILAGLPAWWAGPLAFAAALLPASAVAVGLVNYLLTITLPPWSLPKLSFQKGIPADCATFVVVPCMLTRPESAAEMVERLEIHYLANTDPHLYFALLTDFADAPGEHMPGDEETLQAARAAIDSLNRQHAAEGPPRFFLLHRRRQYNPCEGCWMGWERKRGKLCEFNRLLRGGADTSYLLGDEERAALPKVRYVITLDADTQLPRETARRLVGTLAHPLNRPVLDAAVGRVVEGFAVLQPRVNISLIAAERTPFARLHAGSAGIDPYSVAVSDVYQDLFGSGSYTGKGIYDVDAFEAAAGGCFPDNCILSHDLIEGNFARCGLVTDVQVLDEYPPRYNVWARREHRWIRGDWQILPWVLGSGPAAKCPGLPLVERWKILDNLRRSLVPVGVLLLMLLGWTVLPGPAWAWTLAALAAPVLPLLLHVLNVARAPLSRLGAARSEVAATAAEAGLSLCFLVDHARISLDAAARTLTRLFVTRRRLLEWETAASTEARLGNHLPHYFRSMASSVVFAVSTGVLVALVRPGALAAASPLLIAWALAPLLAWRVSQPSRAVRQAPLSAEDVRYLRRVARKTWGFFDTFVGDSDHWLPPDNYQESPRGVAAHRTSPTNIGLLLLSTLAAHDLGYLGLRRLIDRLERTFATLAGLERYRGHFFNWYDTTTLEPLPPGYLSTVDSGNLLGCLIALKQGLREKLEEPWPGPVLRLGLDDTLSLMRLKLVRMAAHTTSVAGLQALHKDADSLALLLAQAPADLAAWAHWLEQADHLASGMAERIEQLGEALGEGTGHLGRWTQSLLRQVRDHREDLAELAPWVPLLPPEAAGEAGRTWNDLRRELLAPASVATRQAERERILAALEDLARQSPAFEAVARAVRSAGGEDVQRRCHHLADLAVAWAAEMDFTLLYNDQRHLFSIGYNTHLHRLDAGHYDLLASESALTSFLAVARGDAPRRHWFQLGRPLTRSAGRPVLLSWGGTMFEYLMPRLLLRTIPDTLLDTSMRTAVARQIAYGGERHVPWGISESGYYLLDASLDYQYQSFGVPGLGLKRGLGRDLVIAPYATGLAAMVDPVRAAENLRRLAAEDVEGPFGFYEAADYTAARRDPTQRSMVVRSYMAHHQGMTLVALTNRLLDDPMPRRFHAEPMVRATELLLQERMPHTAPLYQPFQEDPGPAAAPGGKQMVARRLTTARTARPRTHLLSNGRYTVLLTNAGGGFSTCDDLAVTRWREDATRDHWGQFCYVRDLRSGLVWSAGYQPMGRPGDHYEVVFAVDRAEFTRLDGEVETHLEITVAPEHAAELRRLTLTNHGKQARELELTSYVEVVLAPPAADLAHPAFGKLFLQTEYVPASQAILCWRRPRSAQEKPIWAVHVLAVDGAAAQRVQFETDRAAFLGRGRDPSAPAALLPGAVLGGATGPVLDPIFSLRCRVRLEAGTSLSLAFTTAVAGSREEAKALADAYHDYHSVLHDFEMAWARSHVELQHLRLTTEEAHLYQRLAAHLIYTGPQLRPPVAVRAANQQGQQALWRYGISGDRPILLVRVKNASEMGLVRQVVAAHGYLQLGGLSFDLVMLDDEPAGYQKEVYDRLMQLVRASNAQQLLGKPGGLFVLQSAKLAAEDRDLLPAAARVVLEGSQGTLGQVLDQLERAAPAPTRGGGPPGLPRQRADREGRPHAAPTLPADLLFPNGMGGFTPDGREYVMLVRRDGRTPAPWINVVANPDFGFFVSESGGGYTWAGNSQMNRLTPWSNDPVSDPPGEIVYLRDEQSGASWPVPAALPGGDGPPLWRCRHGQGYSLFEQTGNELEQELLLVVPPGDPVKLVRLRVRNLGRQARRLAAAFYVEWVLGTQRGNAPVQVWCEEDAESGALLAHNPFNQDFGSRVAFVDVDRRPRSFTSDRTEFLGRNGQPGNPAGLGRANLSGRADGASDPCAAVLAPFEVAAGEQAEVLFLLGEAGSVDEVRKLLARYRLPEAAEQTLEAVKQQWDRLLGAVQVRTPEPALDLMLNRWLLYQTLSCRLWGRSAFYQSGGAYGFRDQLQDVMALVTAAPELTREQLLRSARHQFREGDVQHWWHPPSGRGVRTRFSDDFLWLPLAAAHHVDSTGDTRVLDEAVPFLEAPPLEPEQEEVYGQPAVSQEKASLYEHCLRAIDHGLRFGAHGLPLMGTGDWNDGMNRVGYQGKGETVWGAWFLLTILDRWAGLVESRGDADRAKRYRTEADRLHRAIEDNAWDGEWYRRAYFDDGTPLGSAQNSECRIDSLPQSWAAISGRADPERARQGLNAVGRMLVKPDERLVLLFTPPFDKGDLQPGYIRGYVPGIRENGGQYTHGATWVVRAAAALGQGARAAEVLGLLNPVYHAATPEQVRRYKVEPYVVAADVYSEPPHVGRGGWTWYTGSAGWLYRVALEDVLGLRVHGDRLELKPCVAPGWKEYEIVYRRGATEYHVRVDNPEGVQTGVRSCRLDGRECEASAIPLVDDGGRHEVVVVLGGG